MSEQSNGSREEWLAKHTFTPEQRNIARAEKERVKQLLWAEVAAFEKVHPDLKVEIGLRVDVVLREVNTVKVGDV